VARETDRLGEKLPRLSAAAARRRTVLLAMVVPAQQCGDCPAEPQGYAAPAAQLQTICSAFFCKPKTMKVFV